MPLDASTFLSPPPSLLLIILLALGASLPSTKITSPPRDACITCQQCPPIMDRHRDVVYARCDALVDAGVDVYCTNRTSSGGAIYRGCGVPGEELRYTASGCWQAMDARAKGEETFCQCYGGDCNAPLRDDGDASSAYVAAMEGNGSRPNCLPRSASAAFVAEEKENLMSLASTLTTIYYIVFLPIAVLVAIASIVACYSCHVMNRLARRSQRRRAAAAAAPPSANVA